MSAPRRIQLLHHSRAADKRTHCATRTGCWTEPVGYNAGLGIAVPAVVAKVPGSSLCSVVEFAERIEGGIAVHSVSAQVTLVVRVVLVETVEVLLGLLPLVCRDHIVAAAAAAADSRSSAPGLERAYCDTAVV